MTGREAVARGGPLGIDVGRQLFVDDALIAETTLKRTFHQARIHEASPVLKPETPVEMDEIHGRHVPVAAPFDDGVWYDPADGLLKMWYHGGWFDGNCYAVSRDGISWERPSLDVVPGTNRVLPIRHNAAGRRLERDGTTVWLDSTADPSERFKMLVYSRGLLPAEHGELFTSPDGIHWSEPLAVSFPHGDNSSFYYDPFRKVWVFSIRNGQRSWRGSHVRARAYLESADFRGLACAEASDIRPWLVADEGDQADPELGYEPELYKFGAVAYESLMIGAFALFYGPPNEVCDQARRPKIIDLQMGYSRDGLHWHRPDRRPFLACSRTPGAWDRGYLHAAAGVCLVVGDELYFYYGAWSGLSPRLGGHMYAGGSTGLAILRRDGFASMDAGQVPGALTTRPLTFSGAYPFVNVDAADGELRVEVLDAEGRVIAPFTGDYCRPIREDSTCRRVEWEGVGSLARLAGQPVRFRFTLRSGRLYSFWVSPEESGASHGYVAAGGPGFTGPTDTTGGVL